ncbi:hypothetical protein S245_058817, partial [Arachis hypogaea]
DKLRGRERELWKRKEREEHEMERVLFYECFLLKLIAFFSLFFVVVASRYGNYTKGQDTGDIDTDGVDFVFIDSPILSHIENNIYGENQV